MSTDWVKRDTVDNNDALVIKVVVEYFYSQTV